MDFTIEERLERIESIAKSVREDLKAVPDKTAIFDLLEACKKVDENFKDFCASFDKDDKLEPGTTYQEGGLSIEYYIEADDWYDISVALRKLLPEAT